ncbi:MAG TPA: EAL domain-containing protein [Burkholderiales bacterium]|nr:EAL domain-containing protein [Burkholderiales bacterium]
MSLRSARLIWRLFHPSILEVASSGSPDPGSALRPSQRNWFTRRLVAVFALLLALLLAVSVTYMSYSWRAVKQERLEHLRNLVELGAASANVFLTRYCERAAMLAEDVRIHGGTDQIEAARRQMLRYAAADPHLAGIYLFNLDGELVASTTGSRSAGLPRHNADPVFMEDHRRALQSETPVIARVRYGARVADWILPIRMRVLDPLGRPALVLSLVVPLSRQDAMWRGVGLRQRWVIGLLRDDGYLQGSHPTPSDPSTAFKTRHSGLLLETLERSRFPLAGIVEGPSATSRADDSVIAYRRLDALPITAFVRMPAQDVWMEWSRHMQVPGLLFAISLIGLLSAAFWAVRQQREREAERDRAEQSLHASAAALKRQTMLLEQSQRAAQIGAWELDVASGELYWTTQTYWLHEVSPTEYSPTWDSALAFFSSESAALVREAMQRALSTGEGWDLELELHAAKGKRLWVRSTGAVEISGGKPRKAWGSFQDITQRRRSEEQIVRLAHYDELTGLPNRNLFNTHLAHAISRAMRNEQSLAVLFIDLDRFKNINDALGHDIGDEVLQSVATRLSDCVRASDILARLGGDEFIVIAEDIAEPDVVARLAEKLLTTVAEPVLVRNHEFALSVSIGVSIFPQDGTDAQTLLKNADTAMYRAKETGRNAVKFYSAYMGSANVDRLSWETQLKKAISDGDQFVLHYQPRLSLVSGRLTAVECLVRWSNPTRGLVPPGQFIPLCEELGLIRQLGTWVLRTAAAQTVAWRKVGLGRIQIAVNISAQQLYASDFLDELRDVLDSCGLEPGALELEITESVMMQRTQHVADLLHAIRTLGIALAVDDFGTGYSSLAYLKRLPIHSLKIDRSFVYEVPDDAGDISIVRAVIALAHSLGMTVVAEGVENRRQLNFLRSEGCDEIQGYLISRPLSAEALTEALRRGITPRALFEHATG